MSFCHSLHFTWRSLLKFIVNFTIESLINLWASIFGSNNFYNKVNKWRHELEVILWSRISSSSSTNLVKLSMSLVTIASISLGCIPILLHLATKFGPAQVSSDLDRRTLNSARNLNFRYGLKNSRPAHNGPSDGPHVKSPGFIIYKILKNSN